MGGFYCSPREIDNFSPPPRRALANSRGPAPTRTMELPPTMSYYEPFPPQLPGVSVGWAPTIREDSGLMPLRIIVPQGPSYPIE
jgi:hypothetical protein